MRILVLLLSLMIQCLADENIEVYKHGVLHKFVRFDPDTDAFTQNVFHQWENETFDVFDMVKDNQCIAIDLGAWIGTTSIWLSKNFHHVVAVEPDYISLECLQKNLNASECKNVTICSKPISDKSQKVIFGSLGTRLNESISSIKNNKNHPSDYLVESITLKQLIFDTIYKNEALRSFKIGFIKCDIEGGEEEILEDLLHFAYYNKCKVFVSFHLSWWKSKTLADFAYLFKYFKTSCPNDSVCQYIGQNPFGSVLFEPLDDAGVMIKKNLTALIIAFNQLTYVKEMVAQLEKYTSDIVIVDNASNYEPLLDYYRNEFKYTLLRQNVNRGHVVYLDNEVQNLVGNPYLLTDPDLKFNSNLPKDFIKELIDISNHFGFYKVGFALNIDADDLRTDIDFLFYERSYWHQRLDYPLNPDLELYLAPIDTTFCLVNKAFPPLNTLANRWNHIRVGKNFTCTHRPWHIGFRDELAEGEYENYVNNNISSNYFRVR